MKVCFFGTYVPGHMNSILRKKLEMQGVEVLECQEDVHRNIFSILKAYLKLISKHRKLNYDVMIIPLWRGTIALPLAKIISRKPILYYAYVSPYETFVNDRKTVKPNSLKAKFIYQVEKMGWRLTNMIIKESNAEIDYFTKQFKVDKKKFRRLFISADESKFTPCEFKKTGDIFQVLFFGRFIPLHGVKIIIEAAKILSNKSDIKFELCGDGQTKKEMEKLALDYNLTNVQFLGFVDDEVLLKKINESDICLGIFGQSEKASYVVTNKVYQILSSQKPLITMDSNAIREINVQNEKNCILIPRDPEKLVKAILHLKNNEEKRKEIAMAGHKLYEENLSIKKTGEQILGYLEELIHSK